MQEEEIDVDAGDRSPGMEVEEKGVDDKKQESAHCQFANTRSHGWLTIRRVSTFR